MLRLRFHHLLFEGARRSPDAASARGKSGNLRDLGKPINQGNPENLENRGRSRNLRAHENPGNSEGTRERSAGTLRKISNNAGRPPVSDVMRRHNPLKFFLVPGLPASFHGSIFHCSHSRGSSFRGSSFRGSSSRGFCSHGFNFRGASFRFSHFRGFSSRCTSFRCSSFHNTPYV